MAPEISCPLVSVVIPNYNGAAYLVQALESVVHQSYQNFEIIVVDDGSSDNSAEILKQYGQVCQKLTIIYQENSGVAAARNTGIASVKGDYIAFLDSDDFWHPDKLKLQVEFLESAKNYAACYSSFIVWSPNADGEYLEPENVYAQKAPLVNFEIDDSFTGWIYHLLLQDVYVWTGTIVIRKSALSDIGVFDPELRIGEDHDLWLRLADKFQIAKLKFATALYRSNPQSVTKKIHSKNYAAIVVEQSMNTRGLKSKNGVGISDKQAAHILYELWFRYAYHCFWSEELTLAHGAFKKSLTHRITVKALVYSALTFSLLSPLVKKIVSTANR